jgi:crotonobetainyl-CoA:carnitine CoA-transferase CaiB-like acyl-CoA transferase
MDKREVNTGASERTADAPLAGIRVLDFSHILAGPYCTRLLADFGAEVVKIETRTRPDLTGALRPDEKTPGRQDRPPLYLNTNRSKRSLTLNLKTDVGRDIALRLAAEADVIVENFSADVMRRLGLDYERLNALNPRLVFLSLSGYGHTGPRKHWTSMNMNLQAHSGLMLVTGSEGDPPISISNSWNDYIGGIHGSFAVIEALIERRRTGKGAALDISQFECSVGTIGGLLTAAAVKKKPPTRNGNRCSVHTPQGVYRCAGTDEWCAVAVRSDQQWQALVSVIGDPRLTDNQSYRSEQGRVEAADEIDAVLEAWTQTRSCAEVEQQLGEAGVPAVRMHRIADVMTLPQAEAVFPWLEDPRDDGGRRVTGLPIAWDGLVSQLRPAPQLGEHTAAVLQEWLGLSAEEIDELERAGALE